MRMIPDARRRRISGFVVIYVSTEEGWARGRRQRRKWGRDRSEVLALDLDRVLILRFADDSSEKAAA